MSKQEIERHFPVLVHDGYSITSPDTTEYNCIAWATGDTEAWWWPDIQNTYYWPPDVPRSETVASFEMAFRMFGYSLCDHAGHEPGFEKIALYLDVNGKPTHAARQLASGKWTSKLGSLEDIEHTTLESLEVPQYGSAELVYKRPMHAK
jgi:hypothetical protein